MNFVTVGNDCPDILTYNVRGLSQLYPMAYIFLYDWGHSPRTLDRLLRANSNVVVVKWPKAHLGNYMFEKVVCIEDCFRKHGSQPLMYFDSDVIVDGTINEVFEDDRWDIAATWRPDSGYGYEDYGVGSWLNAGILFINNVRPDHSLAFLFEWLKRCKQWDDKRWWLDQVELIRLFSSADVDLSLGADRIGTVIINGIEIRCKTLHYTVYNLFPEIYIPYSEYEPQKAKVLHLKSGWRKVKFRILPGPLKSLWITWIKTNYGNSKILRIANLKFNAILRFVLARLRNTG